MNCPKCKSERVEFQVVAEKEKVGCLAFLLFGIFNALRPTKTKTYAVCQNCGHRWETSPMINRMVDRMEYRPPQTEEKRFGWGVGNVIVQRPANSYGHAQKFQLTISDTKLVLRNGESKDILLLPGCYTATAKVFPYTEEFLITIPEGKNTRLVCSIVGVGKPSIETKTE